MKTRAMFLLSLFLMSGALIMILQGRAQLNESFQAWHNGNREVFRQFAARAGWFIYPAWALAVGGGACLIASYRCRERAWQWLIVILIVLFLFFGLAPV